MGEYDDEARLPFYRRETVHVRVAAVVLLAVLAGIASLTVALYRQSFTETELITIRSDRAGLQMRPGTIVKLRGVDVGRTGETSLNPDGTVDIVVKLKPEMLDRIPSNVAASLEQLTVFGNKHVALTPDDDPSPEHIRAGDVIEAAHVSVEVNQLLEDFAGVLTRLEPAKVNSMLSAVATALDGQGEELGVTIETLNDYLGRLLQDIPTLGRDFDKAIDVLDTYADATPALMKMLADGSVLADSISARPGQLDRFLTSMDEAATTGTTFLALNGAPLADLLASALPTTELLARYSPAFTCTLQGFDKGRVLAEKNFGGTVPGVTAIISVMAGGNAPYHNPEELPVMGADLGPECHGMPDYSGRGYPRTLMTPFDLGGDPNPPGPNENDYKINDDPLVVQLFGPLAGGAQ